MEVEVKNAQRRHPVDSRRLEKLAEWALAELDLDEAQLSIMLVSDRKMRTLNRQYRGIGRPTDVLAFPQESPDGFPAAVLGDVVISMETALRQAMERRIPLEKELDTLLLHGLLHLAGYDHERSAVDSRLMEGKMKSLARGWMGRR